MPPTALTPRSRAWRRSQRLGGVVDTVEDGVHPVEEGGRHRAGVRVRVHAHGGAVDEQRKAAVEGVDAAHRKLRPKLFPRLAQELGGLFAPALPHGHGHPRALPRALEGEHPSHPARAEHADVARDGDAVRAQGAQKAATVGVVTDQAAVRIMHGVDRAEEARGIAEGVEQGDDGALVGDRHVEGGELPQGIRPGTRAPREEYREARSPRRGPPARRGAGGSRGRANVRAGVRSKHTVS